MEAKAGSDIGGPFGKYKRASFLNDQTLHSKNLYLSPNLSPNPKDLSPSPSLTQKTHLHPSSSISSEVLLQILLVKHNGY